ncbi:NAD(P)/FAD-dependent oxidoreductase [Flagellimonas halotolerans]|uniref:NAD(P)/FAD-dependent oxidoreductase n=1 Tax=Flagellimonas halotolerans TaxID=3112164 RepID=A0ABU6INT4_9FLAO|nr:MULTISPECIES: NAD(P)/FAD-dependent oxidoreductase [unclassified Allomuricauda]MEC3964895.1 NAD(P)/FAD-dependent oxidoreductase [Muricauda sp. SYSU M86414]MEC4264741.1 NAD(P)/FAD-dependent oxidoreductase [Muricauda sp. SYSU M84420]
MFDVIIVGGGAAGFYAAIQIAELSPQLNIAIFERGKTVLSKVKVSGGGRCNVTHGEFSPKELTTNYPRGEKELLGPFHKYAPMDVMAFFEERGVPLKIEDDGRVFPKSDSSQSIIDCLVGEADRLGVQVLKNSAVRAISKTGEGWQVTTMNKYYQTKKLMLATGSNPKIWKQLENLGHHIVSPVPSLFTFNINDQRLKGIQGISTYATVEVMSKKTFNTDKKTLNLKSKIKEDALLYADGQLLITHWGLSGPAILKLSAWGANLLHDYNYSFRIKVNWLSDYSTDSMEAYLKELKGVEAKKTVMRTNVTELPKRLWKRLVDAANIAPEERWADITKEQLQALAEQLTASSFKVGGKSTFKEEFVTAGGVDLKEINFKTFESKLHPNLYFAGEIINVDAITGGFNFQNAWTGAFIAAQAIVS